MKDLLKVVVCTVAPMAVLVGSLLFIGAGCMMNYSLTERVTNVAREYNDDVRWARFDHAMAHIPKESRDRFLERRTTLSEELQIADTEVIGIEVDRKNDSAMVRVEYNWTLRSRQLVEKTVTRQEWAMEGRDWVMKREVRMSGSPLVLFEEKPKSKDDDK